MMAERKVLHIIDSFGGGGAETWLLASVKYLNQHPELNTQFDFLASGGKAGIYDEEIKQLGSQIFYCKYSLKNFAGFGKAFKKILKENKYTAVHNHQDFISGWHFLSAGKCLPFIRISHLHNSLNFVNNYVTNPMRWFSYRVGRLLMARLATKITGTSNAVMDEYGYNKNPFKNKRVQPAYCGFEIEKFRYSPTDRQNIKTAFCWKPESKIVLFAGRIGLNNEVKAANEKNPAFAFSIAKQLVKADANWRFIFAGFKGKLGEDMEQEIEQLGLNSLIKFVGLQKDMPALYSAADVLLFPSLWEGLGMVVVEAQANGLTVIASDSVPTEAFIQQQLIIRKSLDEPVATWVETVLKTERLPEVVRQQYNLSLKHSFFSIENSVQNLLSLYKG